MLGLFCRTFCSGITEFFLLKKTSSFSIKFALQSQLKHFGIDTHGMMMIM